METGDFREDVDRAIAAGDATGAAKMLATAWEMEPGSALAGFLAWGDEALGAGPMAGRVRRGRRSRPVWRLDPKFPDVLEGSPDCAFAGSTRGGVRGHPGRPAGRQHGAGHPTH